MPLLVDEVFKENKFERILFFLKERGITDSDALKTFDFEELMFVPGVTEALINEAQAAFKKILSERPADEFSATLPVDTVIKTAESVEMEDSGVTKSFLIHFDDKVTADARDASIEQIFSGLPRSAPFIQYCLKNGKQFMSQLHEDDFDAANSLRGLGALSVKNLHDTYLKFFSGEIRKDNNKLIPASAADVTIEQLFDSQPRGGLFIRHCHSVGIHTMEDLSKFSFGAKDVKGISSDSMELLKGIYLEMLEQLSTENAQDRVLPEIPDINRQLQLSSLTAAGLSDSVITRLNSYGYCVVNDLYDQPLSAHDYFALQETFSFLLVPITVHFEDTLHSLKDASFDSLLQKSQGETLQAIGDKYDLTRERVRQVVVKSCSILLPYAEMVAQAIMDRHRTFESSKVQSLFESADTASCCIFVLHESARYCYLKFSDKFADAGYCPQNIEQQLHLFADEVIGDGLNFYDSLEHIEEELPKYTLEILDFEDIMNYLVQAKYRFYGDYVVKEKGSYAAICYDAISKYFLFDIKLDSDEENNEMVKLRDIIQKHYHGLQLPENNRALTSGITRNSESLVLSGRGRYCPIEKVICSPAVMDDIYRFIQDSPQTSFYYNELFAEYQGRLLAETNITNSNFLHGILMYTYPCDFIYERDMLVKNGEVRQDINDRICRLIVSKGAAMTKDEIRRSMPGINDFMFAFAAARLPRLIQWEYNSFNHMDNIHCTDEEIAILNKIVKNGLLRNNGYISESMLYNIVKESCPEFIEKNHILNSMNLYYVAEYLLDDAFRFRRPHILTADFPVDDMSVANIARELLHCRDHLSYSEYTALAERLGWVGGTQHAVFSKIERDYVRIDQDNYIRRELFHIDEAVLCSAVKCLDLLVKESGYYAVSSIFSYEDFPSFDYEWNGFLLCSVIEEYQTGFKIVSPQVRDRRYLRGALLRENDTVDSFEDLVLSLLNKDGITEISDQDMFKYLKMRGLITKVMPQELYECEKLTFRNDIFIIK